MTIKAFIGVVGSGMTLSLVREMYEKYSKVKNKT